MMQYAWPGNVRELEHTLERAVLMCHTGEIQVSDLGLNVQQRAGGQNLEELSIEEVEGILVRKALQRFHGNVSQAAEALGLSRGALYAGWNAMDSSSGGDYSNPINPSGASSALDGDRKPAARTVTLERNTSGCFTKTHPAVRYPGCAARSRLRHHSRWTRDWTRDIKISLTVLEFSYGGADAGLLDQIVRRCRRSPMWSALCAKKIIPFALAGPLQ